MVGGMYFDPAQNGVVVFGLIRSGPRQLWGILVREVLLGMREAVLDLGGGSACVCESVDDGGGEVLNASLAGGAGGPSVLDGGCEAGGGGGVPGRG